MYEDVASIRERARLDAELVLEEYWDRRLPVDPVKIARDLGLSVFSAQLGDDCFGMIVGSAEGADIYLDRDQPPKRLRFTCAHEIGHYVDNSSRITEEVAFVDRRSDAGRGEPAEVYANEFAGSLLMPEREFIKFLGQKRTDFEIADAFNVSLDAMRYRRHLLSSLSHQ